MDLWQIFALFFGPALAVLGLALRRALGNARMLVLLALCTAAGAYALGVESLVGRLSVALPQPGPAGAGSLRLLFPFTVGSALLGAFGVLLLRFRAR